MKLKFASIALAALIASTAPAQAAITVYTSLAAFTAATTAPGTDTYAGFSITGTTGSPIVRTAGAYGYTGSTPGDFFGAGTSANPWLSTNIATDTITFNTFTGGSNGVGGNFFGSTIAGTFQAGNITIVATDSSGSVTQTIVGATTSSFLGFVSDSAVTSLTVTSVQPQTGFLWPTVDNLVFAKRAGVVQGAVPESSTWLMMLAGFGLVGGAMRRRSTGRIAQAV
jgi:hypothetical protein